MIVMKPTATEEDIRAVVDRIESVGARAHRRAGEEVTVIGAIGDREHVAAPRARGPRRASTRSCRSSSPTSSPRPQLRHGERTVLEIAGRKVGGEHFALIAGPCTVESRDQTLDTAHVVNDAGASMFRGGAYKPRTSPYSFQGLGQEGLRLLAEAKAETGLPIVTELMDARDLEAVLEVADVIQVGARNMQNYPLLAEIGRTGRPVLIKRGLSATLEELLMAAEYVLKEGNPNVMLCERGIRTFETAYRFTLDLMAVPVLKELSHLPVIVDPSHAPGRRDLVAAAVAGRRRRGRRRDHRRGAPEPGGGDLRRAAGAGRPTTSPPTSRSVERVAAVAGKVLSARRVKLAVVGVGLIGGSIGLAARQRLGAQVSGYDPAPAARAAAVDRGAIVSACDSVAEAVAGADFAFVAAPVHALPELVAETLAAAGEDCVVTDVGSTKRAVVRAVEDPRFVGGHPLAGAETAGVEHARADLFDDATWYLTPTAATQGTTYERLHRLITRLGAWPAAIDADTHDVVMATVSHLPHVLANVLVAQAARVLSAEGERLPATGPSFRDVTRVAGANTPLWRGIYLANADALVDAIDDLVERLRRGARPAGGGRRRRGRRLERRRPRGAPAAAGRRPGGRRGARAARARAEPARDRGRDRAGARPRRQSTSSTWASIPQSGTHGTVALWIRGDAVTAEAAALVRGLGLEVARA